MKLNAPRRRRLMTLSGHQQLLAEILVVAATDPDPLRTPSGRDPLPATTVVVAEITPPRPADEENPSMAMDKVAVMKAMPIARTTGPSSHAVTVPGSHAATVPGSHVPTPRAHAGAAGK